jgi:hypothetical protein
MNQIGIVKSAVGGEQFHDHIDVYVQTRQRMYVYKNVYVLVKYNIPYMQMDIEILWDDDTSQPYYKQLGLHMGYNTTFQRFSNENRCLKWRDGDNLIQIDFNRD